MIELSDLLNPNSRYSSFGGLILQHSPQQPVHPNLTTSTPIPTPDLLLGYIEAGMQVGQVGLWKHGALGHFSALHATAAAALLAEARRIGQSWGLNQWIGPLNGSTWFSYRFISDAQGDLDQIAPPFYGEPWHPSVYLDYFLAAGFQPLHRYYSAIVNQVLPDPRAQALEQRFQQQGIVLRQPQRHEIPDLSLRLHQLSQIAFQHNPLFSPLAVEPFQQLYLPLLQHLPLNWIWIAEDEQECVGYCISYPDPAHPQRLVIKTLAIAPQRAYAGLGRYLSHVVQQRAMQAGFQQIIYALISENNTSGSLSRQYQGQIMRRYLVLSQDLTTDVLT